MYDTVTPAGQPFTIAAYPGDQPIIPITATAAQLNQTVQLHMENLRKWHQYTNIHNALKKQLTDAIEPQYIFASNVINMSDFPT
jgi:hypothetical protein